VIAPRVVIEEIAGETAETGAVIVAADVADVGDAAAEEAVVAAEVEMVLIRARAAVICRLPNTQHLRANAIPVALTIAARSTVAPALL
jgi:hypothetical protein